jgi:hypothetical protein
MPVPKKKTPAAPADGLYRVETERFTAGFVVEDGKVTRAAPILRKRLTYWFTRAKRIGP